MKRRLPEAVLEEGAKAVGRAASAILADPRGQEAMARAVGLAQRGLRLFEEVQARALHGAGLAARRDYHDLRKQLARLKRKAREMSARLGPTQAEEGAPASGGGGEREPDDGSR